MNNKINDIDKEVFLIMETLSTIERIDNLIKKIDTKLTSIEKKLDNIEGENFF